MIEHKEKIHLIFHNSTDLLVSSILNTNSLAYETRRFNVAFKGLSNNPYLELNQPNS